MPRIAVREQVDFAEPQFVDRLELILRIEICGLVTFIVREAKAVLETT
jgi:hypothetical protein